MNLAVVKPLLYSLLMPLYLVPQNCYTDEVTASQVGGHIEKGLHALKKKHSIIGDVRGKGLMLGVELVKDRGTKVRGRLKLQLGALFRICGANKHPCQQLT